MSSALRLLMTRPEPDAQRSAELLRERGHVVLVAPLLHFAMIAPPPIPLEGRSGAIVTSANALRAAAIHPEFAALRLLPVFAVGTRTAALARELGFAAVADAQGSADDLLQFMRSRVGRGERFLYLTGEDRARDIAGALAAQGVLVDTVPLYRMVPSTVLPDETVRALKAGEVDAVLHYSRRTAEAYLACAKAGGFLAEALAPEHLCLSAQVAAPIREAGARQVGIAARPNEPALLALLRV